MPDMPVQMPRALAPTFAFALPVQHSAARPAWPAIASQLWGRRSATDNELLASEVAAIVAREISALLGGRGGVLSDQLEIDAATGFQSRKHFEIHPDCGCVIPGGRNRDSGVSAEVRPEIGSAFARGRQKPTKGTAVVELE